LFQGIYANAHAHKTAGGRVTRDWKGTTPGSITVNGQTNPLPRKGSYEIPGVATVTTGVVKKSRTGIRVTAVRIALSGVDTVINLGNAKARISRH
jgi:hypothetical protein